MTSVPSLPHIAARASIPAIGSRTTLMKRAYPRIIGWHVLPVIVPKGKTGNSYSETLAAHMHNGVQSSLSPATSGGGFGPAVFPSPRDLSSVHNSEGVTHKFSWEKIMSIASRIAERFRSRLSRIVEKERHRLGCAKLAMKAVGKKIGMSPISVYRAMNGYGSVQIHAHHYVALLTAALAPKSKFSSAVKSAGARFVRRPISHPENLAAP